MIHPSTLITGLIVALVIVTSPAYADPGEILVLYHGTTETNREAMKYLASGLRQAGVENTLRYTQKTKGIGPGQFQAILIINSGFEVPQQIDPVLKSFLENYPAPKEVILLTFVKGGKSDLVTYNDSAKSAQGVDAITAASTWLPNPFLGQKGNLSDDQILNMHKSWLKKLISLLNQR